MLCMNVNIYGGNLHNNPSDLILNSLGKKIYKSYYFMTDYLWLPYTQNQHPGEIFVNVLAQILHHAWSLHSSELCIELLLCAPALLYSSVNIWKPHKIWRINSLPSRPSTQILNSYGPFLPFVSLRWKVA